MTVGSAPAAYSAGSTAPPLRDAHGLHVVSVRTIDDRQLDAEVLTPALGRPAHVRVLLPRGYAANPQRRYPTLYLITGTGGVAGDWVALGKAAELTANLPLIVVMPDVGFGTAGWFSNWRDRTTKTGPNQWETFYIDQLVPWIDANLRTRADRNSRAVAGLSQGGFGSMECATRHPDMFASAGAFSGAIDIAYDPKVATLGHDFVIDTTVADGINPVAVFGSPASDEINWQGHDPTTLLPNVRGMDVWLYTGNGLPGPHDDPTAPTGAAGVPAGGSAVEVLAHTMTHAMYDHATELDLPVHLVDYGPGTHSWPYWIDDLTAYLPRIMSDFATASAPVPTSYVSIDRSWTQWGWSVRFERATAEEMNRLSDATAHGFRLDGTGTATVTTPAFYRPGVRGIVAITANGTTTMHDATADPFGHLSVVVPLAGAPSPVVFGRPDAVHPGVNATVAIAIPLATTTRSRGDVPQPGARPVGPAPRPAVAAPTASLAATGARPGLAALALLLLLLCAAATARVSRSHR